MPRGPVRTPLTARPPRFDPDEVVAQVVELLPRISHSLVEPLATPYVESPSPPALLRGEKVPKADEGACTRDMHIFGLRPEAA